MSQNLDQEVDQIDEFTGLVGGSVTAVPNFKENVLTFGVAYGLCVQALDKAQIHTNLLPGEIITKRLVKAKKPWAVAAAALLLTGMAVDYASHYSAWRSAAVTPAYNHRNGLARWRRRGRIEDRGERDGCGLTRL